MSRNTYGALISTKNCKVNMYAKMINMKEEMDYLRQPVEEKVSNNVDRGVILEVESSYIYDIVVVATNFRRLVF